MKRSRAGATIRPNQPLQQTGAAIRFLWSIWSSERPLLLNWVVRPRKNFEVTMVQTYGLTHINLAVRDLGRALRFYEQVFGLREYGRGDGLVHTQAFGRHDILTFAEDPDDIDRAIAEVERAGGRLLRRGEFAPGLPYAYVADPDGYEIEIWFE